MSLNFHRIQQGLGILRLTVFQASFIICHARAFVAAVKAYRSAL